MLLNPIVMTFCLALLICFGPYVALASSSEDDDNDNNAQEEDSQQNEQQAQPSQGTQSQVTWKTFKDRNNLFTVQYPSNWVPSGVAEADRAGPIDALFLSPGATPERGVEVDFMQLGAPSVYQTD